MAAATGAFVLFGDCGKFDSLFSSFSFFFFSSHCRQDRKIRVGDHQFDLDMNLLIVKIGLLLYITTLYAQPGCTRDYIASLLYSSSRLPAHGDQTRSASRPNMYRTAASITTAVYLTYHWQSNGRHHTVYSFLFCLTPHLNRLDMSARNKPPTINVTMFGELGVFK